MHNMLYSIIMMTFEIIGQNRLAASNKAGGIRTREGAGHSNTAAAERSAAYRPTCLKNKGFGKRKPRKKIIA